MRERRVALDSEHVPIEPGELTELARSFDTTRTECAAAASVLHVPPPSSLTNTTAMSKRSPAKVLVTLVLSIVLLSAGLAVLIGLFGVLVKLFGAG
ncbi:hypothetical protein B0G69_5317 [Paraburkholderia sp. RAU2J]|nr:hypothetical protein B0G69_5317 [Paraburkholderia sp. RAU2J]